MDVLTLTPRSLKNEVVVVTVATTEVGIITAKLACLSGARVVLAAPNLERLQTLVDQIEANNGRVLAVVADCSRYDDLEEVKDAAIAVFGKITCWINNSSIPIYDRLLESSIQEERKSFDLNFWSVRIGSSLAVQGMPDGGVLINLGNEINRKGQPFLGIFNAAKASVKVFTNTLRVELKEKKLPIKVSLIRPGRNPFHTGQAIIRCIKKPKRDVLVDKTMGFTSFIDTFFPNVGDALAQSRMKEIKDVPAKLLSFKGIKKSIHDLRHIRDD